MIPCDMVDHVSVRCCFNLLCLWLVSCPRLHQSPNFVVDWVSIWPVRCPQIWRDEFHHFVVERLFMNTNVSPAMCHFCGAFYRHNKWVKNRHTKCADCICQILRTLYHVWRNYSSPNLARFLRHIAFLLSLFSKKTQSKVGIRLTWSCLLIYQSATRRGFYFLSWTEWNWIHVYFWQKNLTSLHYNFVLQLCFTNVLLQVKYPVDPAYMKPGEGQLFTKYLSQQSLHIDVWDGDSLLLIGSCIVDFKVYLLSFIFFLCKLSYWLLKYIQLSCSHPYSWYCNCTSSHPRLFSLVPVSGSPATVILPLSTLHAPRSHWLTTLKSLVLLLTKTYPWTTMSTLSLSLSIGSGTDMASEACCRTVCTYSTPTLQY